MTEQEYTARRVAEARRLNPRSIFDADGYCTHRALSDAFRALKKRWPQKSRRGLKALARAFRGFHTY